MGRVLTIILIIAGMILVGVFTATLTSVMMDESEEMEELKREINTITRKIDELNTHGTDLEDPDGDGGLSSVGGKGNKRNIRQ